MPESPIPPICSGTVDNTKIPFCQDLTAGLKVPFTNEAFVGILDRVKLAHAFIRPRVQIAARCREIAMPERARDKHQARAAF